MKLIFMGTPEFAVPCLQTAAKEHEILAVVTQPDKPQGRGMTLTVSLVKKAALELGLPVKQPEHMKDNRFLDELRALKPELGVVVAYGQFLTREILDIPARGWINVHGSLLPKYRGAAPIARAIAAGEQETGLTIQFLDLKMDSGDWILQEKESIFSDDTAETLEKRLRNLAPQLLTQALVLIAGHQEQRTKQNEADATFAPLLTKEDGQILWHKGAKEIHNQIRAMNPWPGAFSSLNGKMLKIWETDHTSLENSGVSLPTEAKPGAILGVINNECWVVQKGMDRLLVKTVQPVAGKRMNAHAYGLGHGVKSGMEFN